eukprot:2095221-Pyramimonas_sp.AAC.1
MPSSLPPARVVLCSPSPLLRRTGCRRASPLGAVSWATSHSWTRGAVARVSSLVPLSGARCCSPTTSTRPSRPSSAM